LASQSNPHLHHESYELHWQPIEATEGVRVHGELYSSEVFIEAHRDLQDSPEEPGCHLPRIIAGLMFASRLSATLNCGRFTSPSGMSRSIDDPNHLVRHSNILLTLKLLLHLLCVLYTIRPITPRLLQGLRRGAHAAVSILVYSHIPLIMIVRSTYHPQTRESCDSSIL
jgi:hypothetical protein